MSQKEIHDGFIKTLGDEYPTYCTVKRWAAEFGSGRESMEDYDQSGHSKDATIDENLEIVHSLIMCDKEKKSISRVERKTIVTQTYFWNPCLGATWTPL